MRIRRPSVIERITQLLLVLLVCGLVYDLADAAGARCEAGQQGESGWCSVWGRTEEPFGWNYETQDIYVRSGLIVTTLFVAAALAPFFAPNAIVGVLLVFLIPYAGSWTLTEIGLLKP